MSIEEEREEAMRAFTEWCNETEEVTEVDPEEMYVNLIESWEDDIIFNEDCWCEP